MPLMSKNIKTKSSKAKKTFYSKMAPEEIQADPSKISRVDKKADRDMEMDVLDSSMSCNVETVYSCGGKNYVAESADMAALKAARDFQKKGSSIFTIFDCDGHQFDYDCDLLKEQVKLRDRARTDRIDKERRKRQQSKYAQIEAF